VNVVGAAFVPMSPLMFRHISGAADPVGDLRNAAVEAVAAACQGAEQVIVLCPVGGREAPGDWRDPTRSGAAHGDPRSLAAQVGEHLLELAGWTGSAVYSEVSDPHDVSIGFFGGTDEGGVEVVPAVALVVLGDGAAARGQGAPGHIDDRSFAFDDAAAAALETGDAGTLADLDQSLAGELMATGRLTWPAAASLFPEPGTAELRWRGDPFGLSYFVAVWSA